MQYLFLTINNNIPVWFEIVKKLQTWIQVELPRQNEYIIQFQGQKIITEILTLVHRRGI